MIRFLKYGVVFLLGFVFAKFYYTSKQNNDKKEEIHVVVNAIKNLQKLVVAKGSFSEIYNYTDSKKYFYDYLSFDKKVIITVTADAEVGYDLSQLEIEIDSIEKKIILQKIPEPDIVIVPSIKYFDLQQSSFNAFTKEDFNKIQQKSIAKIKETILVANLKERAKANLAKELSKIYQLSVIYNWQVVDHTNHKLLNRFKD